MRMRKNKLDSFAVNRLAELSLQLYRIEFGWPPEDDGKAALIVDTRNVLGVRCSRNQCMLYLGKQAISVHKCPVTAARLSDLLRFLRRKRAMDEKDWEMMDGGPWNFSRDQAAQDFLNEPATVDILKQVLLLF